MRDAPLWSLPPRRQSNEESNKRDIATLVGIAFVSIVLWQSSLGGYLLYPLTILSTWFHEMGHGIAALALGFRFEELVIYPDGSGYALSYSNEPASRGVLAVIAASGLLGPTVAGCLLILASRTEFAQRTALLTLSAALAISTVLYVRSLTGWIVLLPLAAIATWVVLGTSSATRALTVQVLGVQGCISIYRDFGYLFSPGGPGGRSDTGQISDALGLPYWFWGGVVTCAIGGMVVAAVRRAHRR